MVIIKAIEEFFNALAKFCSYQEVRTEFKAEAEVLKDKKKYEKQAAEIKEDSEAIIKSYKALLIRCIDFIGSFKTHFTAKDKRLYKKLLIDIKKAVRK